MKKSLVLFCCFSLISPCLEFTNINCNLLWTKKVETKLKKSIESDSGNERLLSLEDIAKIALIEINSNCSNSIYTLKNYSIASDLLNNEYLYITFAPYGYSVISLDTYETVETDPFCQDVCIPSSNDIYYPIIGLIEMVNSNIRIKRTNQLISENSMYYTSLKQFSINYKNILMDNRETSISEKIETIQQRRLEKESSTGDSGNEGRKDWDIDINKRIITADVEIPHSWFFKYNKDRFSYASGGSNGICEYIAFLMLVEYNDFFVSKGYFDDQEISKYVTSIYGSDKISATPDVNDSFVTDLFKSNNFKETLNCGDLNNLSDAFLSNKSNISYKNVWAYWLFGNPNNVIKSGNPIMLCGFFPDTGDRGEIGHNVIAYGYFDKGAYKGKFLTHYGWNGHTQCIVDRKIFKSGYYWALKDETLNSKGRSIFNINGKLESGTDLA